MKILVFGNPDVRKDSLPVKLIPDLSKEFPQIEFIHLDGIDEIQDYGKNIIIIDSVGGIKKCVGIRDPELISSKAVSIHGFDLATNLLLLKKAGLIDSFFVLCVPMKISKSNAFVQMKKLISKEIVKN